MSRLLDADEVGRQLIELPDWEWDGTALRRTLTAPTFRAAVDVVVDLAEVAEELDHHPDVDLRFTRLELALSTHSAKGVTQLDVELAHRVEEIAAEHGAR